jgi:aromatic-L-amino-acid decarboxylase
MSRSLYLTSTEIELGGRLLTELLVDYERSLAGRPVVPPIDREVLVALREEPFPEDGVGIARLFEDIRDRVIAGSTATAHPRFLAYVLGPPNGVAPFADAIAATLNQNCNFWQLSPVASVIEQKVVSWFAALFGFPATAGGLMMSGGSMATATALSAALHDRAAAEPGARDLRRAGLQGSGAPLTVYTSTEAHFCVEKAAIFLGLGTDHVRRVATDGSGRMQIDALASAIEADRAAGLRPACVVATAGTVSTGAVDPLDAIADVCARERLWLHVDGAFGALFVLSPRARTRLLPCGRADSIALDPHKLLFAPLEAGCVIVRDPATLRRAFGSRASYLTVEEDPLFTNYLELGPQLSRSFRAFKIWCAFRALGTRPFSDAIDRVLELTAYLGDQLAADRRFELLAPIGLGTVCFRPRGASEADVRRVLAALAAEGSALLGPVQLGNRVGLRACLANHRTCREDVDLVIERIAALAMQAVG